MARMQTAIISRRDSDGSFLPPERVFEDLTVEENGLTAAENKEIDWLAELLLPMYMEHLRESGQMI